MVAQAGKDLLLKLDEAGTGTFESVAGLRSRRLALNATPIDITDAESTGRWRELLAGAATRHASLSGSGLFRDKASAEKVRAAFFAGELHNWQIICPPLAGWKAPSTSRRWNTQGTTDPKSPSRFRWNLPVRSPLHR